MVQIEIRYDGDLQCGAIHGPSGTALSTDAPVDNQGKGESFSPTDLVATALGTCMMTVMGIVARNHGWTLDGVALRVQKEMTVERPRRIARLRVDFEVPRATAEALDVAAREKLEHAALTCPVRLSIHESIEVPVAFDW